MPKLLRKLLGFILLVTTIALATCHSLVKAEPTALAGSSLTEHLH
ncbi:MAG: hypothetical protein ABL925_11275 [Methylococcales bacterium]